MPDDQQSLSQRAISFGEKIAAPLILMAIVAIGTAIFAVDRLGIQIDRVNDDIEKIINKLDGKRADIDGLRLKVAGMESQVNNARSRIGTLETFRNAGGRFTSADGDRMQRRVDACCEKVEKHQSESERWKAQIEHNTRDLERILRRGQ